MGGPARLERQRAGGRLDARARIDRLCDAGSFVELGTLVGGVGTFDQPPAAADALVGGGALIEGRPVVVGSEDFTVLGGSIGAGTHAKRHRLAELAGHARLPLVMLLDGAGHRAQSALERGRRSPTDLQALAALSGRVPTVAAVMGPSAGHGALTAPLMDWVVMVDGASLFSAGPTLVEQATGERVGKEELGGTDVQLASGVVHDRAANDDEALQMVRKYLSYFPTNAWQWPPTGAGPDSGERRLDEILDLVPADQRRGYDMGPVLETVLDEASTWILQGAYGTSIITALGRLGGQPVAVVANQPKVRAGAVDTAAALKAARFIEVADAFHLPLLFLADNPGVLAGSASEAAGVLRASARMYTAQAGARVAKLHVTLRKAYGFGSSIMAMNPFDNQTLTLAFPGVRLGAMPASGAGAAAGADPEAQTRLAAAEATAVYRSADTMSYDEVIDPRELRNALLAGLRMAGGRRLEAPVPRPGGVRP